MRVVVRLGRDLNLDDRGSWGRAGRGAVAGTGPDAGDRVDAAAAAVLVVRRTDSVDAADHGRIDQAAVASAAHRVLVAGLGHFGPRLGVPSRTVDISGVASLLAAIAAVTSAGLQLTGRQRRLMSRIERTLAIAERLPVGTVREELVRQATRESMGLIEPPASEFESPFPRVVAIATLALGSVALMFTAVSGEYSEPVSWTAGVTATVLLAVYVGLFLRWRHVMLRARRAG